MVISFSLESLYTHTYTHTLLDKHIHSSTYSHTHTHTHTPHLRELLSIQGGTWYEQLKIRPESSDVLHQTKQNVGVQRALMGLINDQHTAAKNKNMRISFGECADFFFLILSHIPHHGTRASFLMVMLTPPAEHGPRSVNSTVVVLENTAKLNPVSKQTSFRWRERTPSLPTATFWHSNQRKYDGYSKKYYSLKHWI